MENIMSMMKEMGKMEGMADMMKGLNPGTGSKKRG